MDVRCDRCQTEYELDDESIAEAGASVQCTSCGHLFVVSRTGETMVAAAVTPEVALVDFTSPSSPDWTLTTEDGKAHRFRDLTTLQKWVVERRVTREDRVSQRGGAARRLGDFEELRPFFEVVEQADRARAAAEIGRNTRNTMPETPRKSHNQPRPHVSPDADDDDIFTSTRKSHSEALRTNQLIDPGFALDDDDFAAAGLPKRRGAKVAIGVVILGLAAVAAYLGFKDPHGFSLPHTAPATPPAAVAAKPQPGVPAPAAAPVPAVPAPVAAPPPPPAAAATPPPPAPAAPAPSPPAPAAEPPPAAEAKSNAPASADAGKPKTYERLVADADHALENGQTTKAQKLYDEALRLQPNGVAAMTGSAYLLLDRQRPLAAIGLFKRVLSNAPTFPAALFGLGEAYRAQGDTAQAIEAYKNYLATAPGGPDAPAARRQVRELGEGAAAATPRRVEPTPSPVESAKIEPPPLAPPATPISP